MEQTRDSHPISRRRFVCLSAGALAAGGFLTACSDEAVLLDSGAARTSPAGGLAAGKKGGGGNVTRHPLFIPETVSPVDLALTAAPARVDLGGNTSSSAWAYNGSFPGPTINAWRGDRATIQLNNGLSGETVTHWHGMIVDDANDGHPRHAVAPGGRLTYDFPIDQRACLNWYHPHPHGRTGEQVALGLAGAFIIRDGEEDALGLPSGKYEVPLIVRDAKLGRTGDLEYQAKRSGFLGDTPLVNGTQDPVLEVDAALYRFRVLNGANGRLFRLALSDGAPFILIGNDGGLLERATELGEILLSPGERLDVLVDFRGLPDGTSILLRDLDEGWDLLEFAVTRQVHDATTIPTTLSSIPKLSNPVVTRTFSFDGMSKINGQIYEMDRVDFQVPLGQTERWIFTTNGNAPHPVHVHAAPFQVQSRTGGRGRVFPWEEGWKDTVLLEDGETVEVLVHFEAHTGLYLMHCHKLEHEDMGMMSNFEIVAPA